MQQERKSLLRSFYFPALFVAIMWLVKGLELHLETRFSKWGVLPRTVEGLKGIIFSPFIHGDFEHLFNNSFPILLLGAALFHFYRPIAHKVFFLTYIIGNVWLWAIGRESYHIGASGIIYGLASFLFFSGVLRKHMPLLVISLLVVFLYGSLVWGIFPGKERISFEGHLTGSLAGIILSFYFRSDGPQRKKYKWEEEPEEEEDDENAYWKLPEERKEPQEPLNREPEDPGQVRITYHYKPDSNNQGANS
jgi:membrane associated rhomboid family serine protease